MKQHTRNTISNIIRDHHTGVHGTCLVKAAPNGFAMFCNTRNACVKGGVWLKDGCGVFEESKQAVLNIYTQPPLHNYSISTNRLSRCPVALWNTFTKDIGRAYHAVANNPVVRNTVGRIGHHQTEQEHNYDKNDDWHHSSDVDFTNGVIEIAHSLG